MNHIPDHDLTERLSRQADQFAHRGGSTLDISQVVERAGEIRRGRRLRATLVMAACVLAIAAPTALVVLDDADGKAPSPAVELDRSSITLVDLAQGDEPHAGHLAGTTFHTGGLGVDLSAVGGRITDVVALDGGYLVAAQAESGDLEARFVDDSGDLAEESRPVEGGFARSADGAVGAFVQPDGVPVLVRDAGATWTELPKVLGGSGFDAVAVTGSGCAEDAGACRVWVNSRGEDPMTWVAGADGIAETGHPTMQLVTDLTEDLVAGITQVRDDGTCSEVAPLDDATPLWSTCDHRFVAFSPDGSRLLATGSYGDGLGDTQLAILDAETGKVQLDLPVTDQAFVSEMVWEDDTHVLAEVFEQGRWAVLRIAVNGTRELAVAPVDGFEDVDSPFGLPAG